MLLLLGVKHLLLLLLLRVDDDRNLKLDFDVVQLGAAILTLGQRRELSGSKNGYVLGKIPSNALRENI